MATIKDYLDGMRQRELVIARALGADLTQLDAQTRVLNISLLTVISVLSKALVDNGVLTLAQINAVLNEARDYAWWSEPGSPADPPGT